MKNLREEILANYTGPERNGHVLTQEVEHKINNDLKARDMEYRKEQAQARAARRNVVLI